MALWWVANALALLVVVPLVVVLAQRVIRLVREIERYATDILTHAGGLVDALDPLPALVTTAERASAVKSSAVTYVAALQTSVR